MSIDRSWQWTSVEKIAGVNKISYLIQSEKEDWEANIWTDWKRRSEFSKLSPCKTDPRRSLGRPSSPTSIHHDNFKYIIKDTKSASSQNIGQAIELRIPLSLRFIMTASDVEQKIYHGNCHCGQIKLRIKPNHWRKTHHVDAHAPFVQRTDISSSIQ